MWRDKEWRWKGEIWRVSWVRGEVGFVKIWAVLDGFWWRYVGYLVSP